MWGVIAGIRWDLTKLNLRRVLILLAWAGEGAFVGSGSQEVESIVTTPVSAGDAGEQLVNHKLKESPVVYSSGR